MDEIFAEVHRSNMTKDVASVEPGAKIGKGPNFEFPKLEPFLGRYL